jgi:nucleoid-associated protein YgaU
LPFRQPSVMLPEPAPAKKPIELTLRRPDEPLTLQPRLERSPAIDLDRHASVAASSGTQRMSLKGRTPDLANLTPPPALPVSFQPYAENASDSGRELPVPAAPPPRPISMSRPKPYRLRDGDTLENVAERFLGTAQRASEIYQANRHVLSRPDLLPVGTTITIPPRDKPDDFETAEP